MMLKLGALVAMVAVGIGGWQLWMMSRPYEVSAYFQSAERLVENNDVQLGGITVGHVRSVQLAPDSDDAGAIVTMNVESKYVPLHRGTRAIIRPKGLLGSMYVELEPGHGAPLRSGDSIPLQDTESPVSLDQVTDVLDAKTRDKLRTLTQQGAAALQGRGQDVNQLLAQLPAISANLAATTGAIDERDQQLDQLQVEFDQLAHMIASEHTSLAGDLNNGADILDTLAQHQTGLQSELQHANSSLGKANQVVGGREKAINQLFKELPALLDELEAFSTNGTTTLATINPCMDDLNVMLAEMRSATQYQQPSGATDGAGFMLRVDPQIVGPSTGTYSPQAGCSG
jgi:phospholipid/cholesterol/gamma-HCH transport system substrate-binding protein